MNTNWRRALVTLVGASTIALTAACGAEVSGVAEQRGSAAPVAVTPSTTGDDQNTEQTDAESTEQTTSENTDADTDGTSGEATATSAPEPATSPSSDEGQGEGTADENTEGTDDEGTADNGTVPAQPSATSSAPSRTSSSAPESSTSSAQYAYLKDYCTIFPESYMKGLKKDTTRKPDLSCVYMNPDSSKKYRGVTVSGGFSFSKEELDQSYNHDLAEVRIDGRAGFVWTNNTKSLYSAAFNLPDEDGQGEISILVIVGDASISPAQMRKQVLELAALVSKKVPR